MTGNTVTEVDVMRAQAQRKRIAFHRGFSSSGNPAASRGVLSALKGHPLFGFRDPLPRHSYHAVTASAELPSLIVKVSCCEDQRAADRVFLLIPAQRYVGMFLQSFQEFPPRQRAGSFSIDQVMEKLAPPGS